MPAYANALTDTVAIVIIICVMIAERLIRLPERPTRRVFWAMLWVIAAGLMFDIPAWMFDGKDFPGAREVLYTLSTLYHVCLIVSSYLWILFSKYWIIPDAERDSVSLKYKLLWSIPMIAELLVIFINLHTSWIFSINADNSYVRGPYYFINLPAYYVYSIAPIVMAVKEILRPRDADGKRSGVSLLVFMVLPVFGAAMETLYYGISWTWPLMALALLIVFLSEIQRFMITQQIASARQAEKEAQLKNELTNSRVAIMLSQMQPHFLFNALSSIKVLCTRDPNLAAQAAGDFSEFLRNNIDSLTDENPVAFTEELDHTKHYLALELIRFAGRLNIVYDIKTERFRIPTLALQPIVENAVRYGVTKRVSGGTVTISTREESDRFVVTVSDDGVGFDPGQKPSDGRNHIGIKNVKNRLRAMCQGTLEITSAIGEGTTAVISIPKTRGENSADICP